MDPNEQYEAARIDGANRFQSPRYHAAVVAGDARHRNHAGGDLSAPGVRSHLRHDLRRTGRSTQATWMYFNTFQYHHAGFGSAIAWVIALISMIVTIPYIRLMSRR